MDIDLKEKEFSASVNNKSKASDVTNDDVMDLELEGVTDIYVEDVLIETDDNNIDVRIRRSWNWKMKWLRMIRVRKRRMCLKRQQK